MTRTPSWLPFRWVVAGAVAHGDSLRTGCQDAPIMGHKGAALPALLPTRARAREPLRLLGGAKECLGFVDAFLLLAVGIGIRNDACAGLDVHDAP